MRGPNYPATVVLLMLVLAAGCDLNSVPLGRSTLSARIDGVFVKFNEIESSLYVNLITVGRSDSGKTIGLVFHDLSVGSHGWFDEVPPHLSPDQAGHLDGSRCWPDLGGYVVERYSDGNRHLVGSFAFCIVDTVVRDTTFVTDGRFDLYYGVSG